jgi:hypothetical protein
MEASSSAKEIDGLKKIRKNLLRTIASDYRNNKISVEEFIDVASRHPDLVDAFDDNIIARKKHFK